MQGKTIKPDAEHQFCSVSNEERAIGELRVLLEKRMAEASSGKFLTQGIADIADEAIKVSGTE